MEIQKKNGGGGRGGGGRGRVGVGQGGCERRIEVLGRCRVGGVGVDVNEELKFL